MSPATVRDLPNALRDTRPLADRLAGRRPAAFLDYDGVLTPIVERPEDAVMAEEMRRTVRALAGRCPVCVVSGRDRAVLQRLMGMDDLVVAGSHGFDIWSPGEGTIPHDAAAGFDDLVTEVTGWLRAGVGAVPGVDIEPKRASVAVHYRLVAAEHRERIAAVVRQLVAEHAERLRLVPGKMVYEVRPNIDWDKGRAVLHLIDVLGLDADEVVPVYLGDDVTDEDAFRVLRGRGIGVIVGAPDDPEVAERPTDAEFVLDSVAEVRRFLSALGR
jgi:trehalose 6-phosphate phosphatase